MHPWSFANVAPPEGEPKPTIPVGAIENPPPTSDTVAVQVVGVVTATGEGEQDTLVELERGGPAHALRVDAAHARQPSPTVQMPCRRKPVAGVVADSANHDSGFCAEPGHGPAGRLHQPVDQDPEPLLRERVELFDLPAIQER